MKRKSYTSNHCRKLYHEQSFQAEWCCLVCLVQGCLTLFCQCAIIQKNFIKQSISFSSFFPSYNSNSEFLWLYYIQRVYITCKRAVSHRKKRNPFIFFKSYCVKMCYRYYNFTACAHVRNICLQNLIDIRCLAVSGKRNPHPRTLAWSTTLVDRVTIKSCFQQQARYDKESGKKVISIHYTLR